MAEDKIILTQIDIDVEASIKDTIRLKEEIAKLKKETDLLKETEGETSASYIQANATLKAAQSELKSNEAITQKVISANRANAGSLDELKAKLAVVSKQWSAMTEDQRLNTEAGKKLTAQKLALTNQLKAEEKATGDTRRNVGNYTEGIGNATNALDKFVPGASAATNAAKGLGVAFKVMLGPIGLIIAAITALYSYFTRSEEGQNKLAKAMAVFKVVLGNIMDVVSKLGEYLVKAFESPKEAIKYIGEFIKSQITNRIEALKNMAGALMKVFSKDWKEGLKELGSNYIDALTGVKDTIGKVKGALKEMGDEMSREIDMAKKLADQQANLDKQIRAAGLQEKKDILELAKLKNEIDDKDKNNGQERLKLIDEENALLDKMQERNLNIAKQKAYIHGEQIKMSASTKEDLDEQARLEGEIYQIEANITAQRKEAIAKRLEAINQIKAEQQKAAEDAIKNLELELAIWNETRQSKLAGAKELTEALITEEENRITLSNEKQKELLQQQFDAGLISQEESMLAILQMENDKNQAISDLRTEWEQQERDRKIEAAQIDFENDQALLQDNLLSQLEAEKKALELKEKQEIESAKKVGADVLKVEQKFSKAKKAIAKAERDAKLAIASDFANNIVTIAGEGTAVGKAAAVASTTIATYQSATQAFSAMSGIPIVGPVLGAVAAAAAVASGIMNVKKILSVKSGLPGDSGGGGGGSASAAIPATTAPEAMIKQSVNPEIGAGIVSRSTAVADSGGMTLQPTLVEDEVTSKQNNTSQIKTTSVL